ncbi:MAG TPA: hypothetical protein VGH20_14695 [Myxococcales bacterium]
MADLQPNDVLFIPNRRRITHALLAGPEGRENLHIFYGAKEIIFREPELLPFGNELMKVERFRAEEARSWSKESPYEWEKVRGLLEALIGEEILKRFDETAAPAAARTFPATLGRNPEGRKPETYTGANASLCPVITERVLGRPMELGNLEVALPIHRVAHPAVDKDGRQVGENNVVDKLFLDIPTERKLCNYAGTRYHADAPINVTAMKHMSRRWPELLSLTEQYRAAFFEKLPPQDPNALRAGEVHLLAVGCLATVGYVMVRGEGPVANGELDAGLAATFRLIDGVRIVTTDMAREVAGANGCERIVNAKAIADYAERNSLYNDQYGVCAGPAALIDEYLRVLLDGQSAPIKAEPSLAERVGDLDAAIEYGLHGSRVETMERVFGAVQGLLHERLRMAFDKHAPSARTKLREILQVPINRTNYPNLRDIHPLHEVMHMELRVGRWLFARARQGLPAELPGTLQAVDELWKVDASAQPALQERLAEFFAAAAPEYAELPHPLRFEIAAVTAEFFQIERSCLRAVSNEQALLNQRIRRQPGKPLTGDDVAVYNRRTTPSIANVLRTSLGIEIASDANSTVLSFNGRELRLFA